MIRQILNTILFLLFIPILNAQTITGTWQGEMEGNEYLEVNVIQVGDNLCGYTLDYDLQNKKSFCKAYFTGSYNKQWDAWYLEGTSFMENSGGHVLMQLKFKLIKENGSLIMKGICRVKPSLFFSGGDDPSSFVLTKVAATPTILTQYMKDCVAEITPVNKEIKKSKSNNTAPIKKTIPIEENKTTILLPKPVIIAKDTVVIKAPNIIVNSLPAETKGRINKELKRIIVHDKKITLNIYDNGTIDGDTVSIYYNGRAIIKNKGLTANALVAEITLDENVLLHSIILYAENLGSIPPNTALIVFTTKQGKRYELFSSATLQQNAEIVFEYKPQ